MKTQSNNCRSHYYSWGWREEGRTLSSQTPCSGAGTIESVLLKGPPESPYGFGCNCGEKTTVAEGGGEGQNENEGRDRVADLGPRKRRGQCWRDSHCEDKAESVGRQNKPVYRKFSSSSIHASH